jgi:hypothetical protein
MIIRGRGWGRLADRIPSTIRDSALRNNLVRMRVNCGLFSVPDVFA